MSNLDQQKIINSVKSKILDGTEQPRSITINCQTSIIFNEKVIFQNVAKDQSLEEIIKSQFLTGK